MRRLLEQIVLHMSQIFHNIFCFSFQASVISLGILLNTAVIVNPVPVARPRPFFPLLRLFGNSEEPPEYLSESDEIAADYLDDDDIAPEDFSGRPPSEARRVDFKNFPFLSQLLFTLYDILV